MRCDSSVVSLGREPRSRYPHSFQTSRDRLERQGIHSGHQGQFTAMLSLGGNNA